MTAAADFAPLLTRVGEIVFDGAGGGSRAIASAYRFDRSISSSSLDEDHAADAQIRKTCFPSIASGLPRKAPEGGNVHDYDVVVLLSTFYQVPDEAEFDLVRDLLATVASDVHRLRIALGAGYMGATEAAEATGVADGVLWLTSWRAEPPDLASRLLRASVYFGGVVTLSH